MFEYRVVPVGGEAFLKEATVGSKDKIELIESNVSLQEAMERAIAHWAEAGWDLHSFQVHGESATLVFEKLDVVSLLNQIYGAAATGVPTND